MRSIDVNGSHIVSSLTGNRLDLIYRLIFSIVLETPKNPSSPNNIIEKNENTNKYKKHIVDAMGTANIIRKNSLNMLERTGRMSDAGNPATSDTTLIAVDIGWISKNDNTYNTNVVAYISDNILFDMFTFRMSISIVRIDTDAV